MKKERYIFTKRLKLSFIFFLFLFAGFVLQKINDYQDYSPTIIIENSHFKTSIPLDLYQNITAQASFKAEHNFLGIIAVKFNTHQKINDDFLQFSLKEKGQKNWLYTAKYKVDQFQNNEYFPFGFPKITNSKGKTYEIEIKSLLGNNQNYVTLSPFSDDFIIKYDFTKKYLQNNKTKIPIYSLNKAISLIKHLNITSLCFIFFTPLILYIFLNTKPGKALSQCFRYSPPNNLSVKKKRTSLPSLTNPKTKYPNSVYKIFFSFFTLIIFLLIISGLILICNGHIEASEWLIYKICSITTFISAAIFINPRFRVKPIFFKISFLLIITLFLIQIYFLQYPKHLINYGYLIFTSLAIIPAFHNYFQNHNLKTSLKIFLINILLIFYISTYFAIYIDSFSILKFILIVLLTIFFNTYKQDKTLIIKNKIVVIVSFLISVLIVFLSTQQSIDIQHYSYYVGPAYEISQGKSIVSDYPSQYGYLSIHFIKLILEPIGINISNFHLLNQTLFGLYFIGFFVVFIKITQNPFLTIILTTMATFFQTYFAGGKVLYPSTGPLRFGFGILLVSIILYIPKKYKLVVASLVSSITIFWSIETAIYIVPAFIFTIVGHSYINSRNLKEFFILSLKKIAPFIYFSCSLFVLILIKEYGYHQSFPPLLNYFQYATVFTNGYGSLLIPFFGNYYTTVLILIIGIILTFHSIYQKDKDNIALALNFISIQNVALFSYFISRSHQNNIVNISPYIFLEAVMVYYYFTRKINKISKYYLISIILFFVTFFVIANNNLHGIDITSKGGNLSEALQKYQQLKKDYSLTQDNVLILSYFLDTEIITYNKIKTNLPLNPSPMTTLLPDYQQKYLLPNLNKIKIGTTLVYTQDQPVLFDFLKNNFTLKEVVPKTNSDIFSLYTIQTK